MDPKHAAHVYPSGQVGYLSAFSTSVIVQSSSIFCELQHLHRCVHLQVGQYADALTASRYVSANLQVIDLPLF